MRLILSIALFLSCSSAMAFKIEAKKMAQSLAWDSLVQKTITEGSTSETGVSQIKSLGKVVDVIPGKSRMAYYFELSGAPSMFGEFFVNQAALSRETWTLKDDGKVWIVDQWFFYLSPKGEFQYAHHRVIEKEGITIHSLKDAPLGTKEDMKADIQSLLDMWIFEK